MTSCCLPLAGVRHRCYLSGPGFSKLTMWLVNETLNIQNCIVFRKHCYFLLKIYEELLQCKSSYIISSKKYYPNGFCEYYKTYLSGPGFSKLTIWLVNETLNIQNYIVFKKHWHFLLKIYDEPLQCKSSYNFSAKNITAMDL